MEMGFGYVEERGRVMRRERDREGTEEDEALQRGCESKRGLESKSGEGDESEKELQSLRAMEVGSDNALLCKCCVLGTVLVTYS